LDAIVKLFQVVAAATHTVLIGRTCRRNHGNRASWSQCRRLERFVHESRSIQRACQAREYPASPLLLRLQRGSIGVKVYVRPHVSDSVRNIAPETLSVAGVIDAASRVRNASYSVNWVILEKWRARAWISARFSVRRRSRPNFSTVKLPITDPYTIARRNSASLAPRTLAR
jgi:hypothetical protein